VKGSFVIKDQIPFHHPPTIPPRAVRHIASRYEPRRHASTLKYANRLWRHSRCHLKTDLNFIFRKARLCSMMFLGERERELSFWRHSAVRWGSNIYDIESCFVCFYIVTDVDKNLLLAVCLMMKEMNIYLYLLVFLAGHIK
jgi:hypothetical protein